jgi:hypothetical protein
VPRTGAQEGRRDILYRRCAGLDVHKDTVVAGLRLAEAGSVRTEIGSFAPTTP